MSHRHRACRKPLVTLLLAAGVITALPALADGTPQTLPFSQNWSNTSLITSADDWSSVPGILGYRGDGLTSANDVDPQTVQADGTSTPVDVNANQTNPNTFSTGGVTEFELADPVVALTGSGTADAPFLLIHLDTRGFNTIQVNYNLRDLDGSSDNSIQQTALQYRVGSSGDFTNLPAGYVADATSGPSLNTQSTPVSATLPAAADNQALVQVRIITSNATGNDEWVGIDDIAITGTSGSGGVDQPIIANCPGLKLNAGESGSVDLTASDSDGIVNAASITSGAIAGIELGALTPAASVGGEARVTLNVDGGQVSGNHAVMVTFVNDSAATVACNVQIQVQPITPIPAIQGSGASSTLLGQTVTTGGVVTKVIPGYGWFLQDDIGDGDAATSDGLFVYAPAVAAVVGNRMRLTGIVAEFNGLTELTGVSAVSVLGSGNAIPLPANIVFPEVTEGDLERYESMLVRINAELTVAQNYFQGRYGEVTLATGGRLEKPTNRFLPGSAEALALAEDNARRRITLDDGSNLQNPNPIPYIGADNTLRAGDTVNGLTGVLYAGAVSDSLRDFKLHPTEAPVFVRANPRETQPQQVGGNVKVASFNVLNYFSTLDQAGAQCFPSLTRSDCRGADSVAEFERQRAKIVAALIALDADVVGLMEIENNGNGAVDNLVQALNGSLGGNVYASVPMPVGGTGSDAIRVAMIYKPDRVNLAGAAVSDADPVHHRPPLAQSFDAANGERFSVIVNHFKSKGSCPANPGDINADQGDGQGCWNPLRVEQAQALRAFIADLQAASGDTDVLVIGDLNAYGKEDPVTDFTDNGFVDQIARFNPFGYSYVFDGESGYLDQALASASLSTQITGALEWHINADEPSVIDYNTEFKPQDLYSATPYRSSDHDPVLVGLNLVHAVTGTAGRDTLRGSVGDDILSGGPGADTLTGYAGNDQFVYTSVLDGIDTLTDFQVGYDRIVLTQLLASLGISSADPLASRHVTCSTSGQNALIGIDADGSAGNARSRSLVLVKNANCASLARPANFNF